MTDLDTDRTGDGFCPASCECPNCGNNWMDDLVWDDEDRLHCTVCGTVYDPDEKVEAK